MNPEQQLVQQICQAMSSGQLEHNAHVQDLAVQFAELCQKANDRLVRCADYLDKGMRSEAVHEARSLPDLLQLAELLEFDGVKKWRNICADLEFPPATPLDAGRLARLREACSREGELEPLVKEYRRAVYQGDHDACIGVLRRLRQTDPDNPSWAVNLRPLEEAALENWCAWAEAALDEDDRERQRMTYDELTHPMRVVPAPAELLRRLRVALMSEQAEELQAAARKIQGRLREALAADDGAEIEAVLEQAAALAGEEAFLKIPSGWEEDLAAGQGWLERQARQRASQAELLAAVEAMQEKLADSHASELDLRQGWERLLAREQPVSEMLTRQVEERLAAMERARRRRGRLAVAVVVLVVLAVLAGSGLVLYKVNVSRRQAATYAEMEQLFKGGEYGALQLYMDKLRQSDPGFHQSPKVSDLRRQLERILAERGVHQARFAEMQQEWEAIRRAYEQASPERVQRFLEEAHTVVRTLEREAAQRVQSWQQGWERWQERRRLLADQELRRAAGQVTAAVQAARKQPFAQPELEQQKLEELQKQVQEAQAYYALGGVEAKSELDAAREQLAGWEREKQQREAEAAARQQELARQRQDLLRSLPDLGRYRQQLARMVEAGGDDPVSLGYKRCLAQFGAYEGAVVLQGFQVSAWPLPAETDERLRTLVGEGGAALRTIWENDLRRLLRLVDSDRDVRQRIKGMLSENQEMLNLYVWRYRPLGGEWRSLYMPKELIARQETADDGTAYTRYFGYVYHTEDDFGAPQQVHTSRAFQNHFTTREYEIDKAFNADENRCAYARFLYRFVLETDAAPSAAEHILSGLRVLRDDKAMEPVPRAWLMKRLVNLLSEHFRPWLPESAGWAEAMNMIGTEVPWMNPKHSETIAAVGMFEEALEQVPAVNGETRKLRQSLQALMRILTVELRCVGALRPDRDGRLTAYYAENAEPDEVWVLLAQSAQAQPVFKLLSSGAGALRPDVLAECFPGLPLFAPAPGQGVDGVAERLFETAPEGIAPRDRPAAWPVNAWP